MRVYGDGCEPVCLWVSVSVQMCGCVCDGECRGGARLGCEWVVRRDCVSVHVCVTGVCVCEYPVVAEFGEHTD